MTGRLSLVLALVAVVACGGQTVVSPSPSQSATASPSAAPTDDSTQTPAATATPTSGTPTPTVALTPTATATPTSAATPTQAATQTLAATPTSDASDTGATPLPAPVTALEPGRYTKVAFEPALSFEVSDDWTAAQATTGFFDIQNEPGSLDVVAVQFANVSADSPEALAAAIQARENLFVSEPETVEVDGRVAIRLVVETTDPPGTNPPVFRPVLDIAAGPLSIASARRLVVTLVDVDGDVLAILVGGSVVDWDRALEIATPVVDSVVFE